MAFLKDMEYAGLKILNAYVKVVRVEIRDDLNMNVVIGVSSAVGQSPIFYQAYETTYDEKGGSVFDQSYNYLESLPEFAGAVPA
ncbi:hypothetical protein [Burkholderia phage BCSR5]|nr:hypothetical protein [Burkholderia phage BCSR5]